ncbi:hypothetical protein FF011L_03760 [Roseimaritima multifibrata]|uniref:Uncharacterized protein n=1 Tax=Roseimaritima multifibrata TaxID=1930274 RepID=A0A517M9T2_9BACT|nr:hypothetical protein FF011L_03760 [Roseimaritima multifibrata]
MPACLAGSQDLEFWLIEFRFRAAPAGSQLAEKDRVGVGIQVAASCCTDRDEPGGNIQEQRERKSSAYLSLGTCEGTSFWSYFRGAEGYNLSLLSINRQAGLRRSTRRIVVR